MTKPKKFLSQWETPDPQKKTEKTNWAKIEERIKVMRQEEDKQNQDSSPKSNEKAERWCKEFRRAPSFMEDGKPYGFGSWFRRIPGDYTTAELEAHQGHKDRVRTADCRKADRDQRDKEGDNSDKESDWLDRTSIDIRKYNIDRSVEEDLRKSRDEKRQAKK